VQGLGLLTLDALGGHDRRDQDPRLELIDRIAQELDLD
jgi:hypothetical protein